MYSGKTDYLLRELQIFAVMGAPVIYLNHSLDTRGESFSSHNPLVTTIGRIDHAKVTTKTEIMEISDRYLIIGIDEAQFLSNLREIVLELVETRGKRVLVAGLSGTFRREPFGEILSLIPYCDRLTKLSSCCSLCATNKQIRQAHFSFRTREDEADVLIGGKSEYLPLCRSCFMEKSG